MLGYESENRLKALLTAVGDGERMLESARARLCSIPGFAPHSALQRLDRDENGYVSSHEVLAYLRDHRNFSASESETYRLVKFFDSDEDGRLSFQDFLQMLLPCEDNCLRNITLDRPSYRVGRFDNLPCDVEHALLEIIEKELDLARRLDILKRDLEARFDFSSLAAFRSVDKYSDGRIDTFNLGTFLRGTGHYATERELLSIVRRIDTDGDARLSYSEFADFIKSTYPSSRSALAESVASRPVSVGRSRGPASYSSPLKNSSPVRASSAGRGASLATPIRYDPYPYPYWRYPYYYPSYPYWRYPYYYPSYPGPYPSPPRRDPYGKPILACPDESQLATGLKDIAVAENQTETAKIDLAQKHDFNLRDAFDLFDKPRMGSISSYQLKDGLNAIGVYPTHDEIDLFITRYDKNGDKRLAFHEFEQVFKAHDSYYASQVARRGSNYKTPVYRPDDVFYSDTNERHRNLWRTIFQGEAKSESVRQNLNRNPYFNAYEAFNSCDLNADGRVDPFELQRLVQSKGHYISDKEARMIVEKFDKNKDGVVTHGEFAEEMRPKSPSRH